MPQRGLIPILLIALVMTVSGCKTIQEVKEKDSLRSTLRSYEASLRWGDAAQAYNYLTQALAEKTELPGDLDNIRVTGYQVTVPPVYLSQHMVTQTAVIEFIFNDRQVSRSISDQQTWEFDIDQKHWYRTNPVPAFE